MESAAQSADALYAIQPRTLIRVTGADRVAFLHNLCTNDVRQLQVGGGCEAFFTNVQGKVLAHVFLFCAEDALLIDTVPDQADALLPHLDKYLIREDVSLTNESDLAHIWLRTAPVTLPGLSMRLDLYAHQTLDFHGHSVLLRRVPLATPGCGLLSCTPSSLEDITSVLRDTGFHQVTDAQSDALRVAAQYPAYGRDITVENLPQEVDRDRLAISFTKGCYLGQETVARIDALGHVNRYVATLTWDAPQPMPECGQSLFAEDKSVGTVTSIAPIASSERVVGLGLVRREYTEGSTLKSPAGPVIVTRCSSS